MDNGGREAIDYYRTLGIDKDATVEQVKQAYRDLAIQYHPDRNRSDPDALEKIKAINEAYAVLSNPEKKRDYDTLRAQYGSSAYNRFRSSYTERDIFRNSDIHQVFEELARSFGISGLDDILKRLEKQGFQHFEARRPGLYVKGFFFAGWLKGGNPLLRLAQNLQNHLAGNIGTKQVPLKGKDIHDVIQLRPDHARQGGPYAYYHRKRAKKLVVSIPPGTGDGRKIRLAGMGEEGHGAGMSGDLLLEVKVTRSLLGQARRFLGSLMGK